MNAHIDCQVVNVDALQLEQRVAILEKELARIKRAMTNGKKAATVPWWEQIAGAFANDPIYDEAMRLGREYRESLRPKGSKRRRSSG